MEMEVEMEMMTDEKRLRLQRLKKSPCKVWQRRPNDEGGTRGTMPTPPNPPSLPTLPLGINSNATADAN
jgi:hypothetical protein